MDKFFKIIKVEEPKPKKKLEYDLINKNYEPLTFDELKIHYDLGQKLKCLLEQNDTMNLFIHGISGSGKSLLVKLYIKKYLGLDYTLNKAIFTFDSKELVYYKNNYITEITINLQNFNDINMISEFLNTICIKEDGGFSNKKKIIIIRNIHNVKKMFYIIIKNILDRYSLYNTFIFISNKSIPYIFKGFFICIIII